MTTVHSMTPEQEIAYLRAENAKYKAQATAKIRLKVSEKGAISVYGLGRFPVTLYTGQMTRLLDMAEVIRQFQVDNADSLSVKE